MEHGHVPACAEMVGRVPLFRPYDFGPDDALRSLVHALVDGEAELTVAVLDDGACVGFSWFVPRGFFDRSGYLRLIVVDPAAQGAGVGRALLERLERRHIAGRGIGLLAAEHNHEAHRFYERLGYLHVGTLPDYVKQGLAERIYFKVG